MLHSKGQHKTEQEGKKGLWIHFLDCFFLIPERTKNCILKIKLKHAPINHFYEKHTVILPEEGTHAQISNLVVLHSTRTSFALICLAAVRWSATSWPLPLQGTAARQGTQSPHCPFAQPPAKSGRWNQPHFLRSQSWVGFFFVNIEAIHFADLGQCMLEEIDSDFPFSLVPAYHDSIFCLCFALCTSLKIV